MTMNRRGMTLVELLVAMVAAGLVMGAVYQVLLTNQRVYTVQREQIVGHQTLRAGSEILFSELREISAPEGDILSMASDEIEFRAMRSFGLVCAKNPSSTITVWVRGEGFLTGQIGFVFLDDDPESAADDEWVTTSIGTVIDDDSACSQDGMIQILNVSAMGSGQFNRLRLGAPVRSAETFTYGVSQFGDEWYLTRQIGSATPVQLVGPLDGADGLQFEYFDADGSTTTTPAEVRRVRVTLRTASDATDHAGNAVNDSLTADVFLRN